MRKHHLQGFSPHLAAAALEARNTAHQTTQGHVASTDSINAAALAAAGHNAPS